MSRAPSARRAVGRPKDERADPAIVAATLELMAEGGVRDLRIDDVADRAGVGRATIYRRHRSKNALINAAVSTLVSEIAIPDSGSTRRERLDARCPALADGSGRRALQRFARPEIDALARRGGAPRPATGEHDPQ